MTACISLEGDILSYVPTKVSTTHQRETLIDTGACAKAFSENNYEELKSLGTQTNLSLSPPEVSNIKLASGQFVPVRGQKELYFFNSKIFARREIFSPTKNEQYYTGKPNIQR